MLRNLIRRATQHQLMWICQVPPAKHLLQKNRNRDGDSTDHKRAEPSIKMEYPWLRDTVVYRSL